MRVTFLFLIVILVFFFYSNKILLIFFSEQYVSQEEIINIRMMQQSQTQEFISESTPLGPAQSATLCMIEYNINVAVRSQRRGYMKGVGRQLTYMASPAGARSTVASSSTSVPGLTSAQPTAIPELVHQQVTGMLQLYQQYLQSIVSSVLPGFQLPPMLQMSQVVPPQQGPVLGQPDDEESNGDDGGPADL